MPNTRDYMRTHTASLIVKGYTLAEGLIALNMSKRTYYRWTTEKPDMLTFRIDQLKNRVSDGELIDRINKALGDGHRLNITG